MYSLAKVSDRSSFRLNQNYYDSFRYLYPNQSETKFSIRISPSSDWSEPNFQSELIRMNPRSEWFGLILIENSVKINPSSDWFRLIRIVRIHSDCYLRLNRIKSDRFFTVFLQTSYKTFSDQFEMICIGSDTVIGMNRNSSDWVGMNSYPILSLGLWKHTF